MSNNISSYPHFNAEYFFHCPGCHQAIDEILCLKCQIFYPETNINYFVLFKCSPDLDLDLHQLELRYYVLQRLTHPDQQKHLKPDECHKAVMINSLINRAYSVLKDQLSRALYFFGINDQEQTVQNSKLLMQIMELQEELGSIKTFENLSKFQSKIHQKFDDVWLRLKNIKNQKISPLVELSLNELQYLNKLISQTETMNNK